MQNNEFSHGKRGGGVHNIAERWVRRQCCHFIWFLPVCTYIVTLRCWHIMDTWLRVQDSNKNQWIVWNQKTFHAIDVCMFASDLPEWISNLKGLPHGENWFLVTCALDWLLPAIFSSTWQTWPPTVKGIMAVKWRKSSRMPWRALLHSYHLLTNCSNKLALWRVPEQCTSYQQSLLWQPCNIRSKQLNSVTWSESVSWQVMYDCR